MIKKWLILIPLLINGVAYSETIDKPFEDEPLVSDCSFDIEALGINKYVEKTQECILEQMENSESELAQVNSNFLDEIVDVNKKLVDDILFFMNIVMGFFVSFWLYKIMSRDNQQNKKNRSELILKSILGIGMISLINSTNVMRFAVEELSNKVMTNATLPLTAMSNMLAQSDEELERQINPLIPSIYQKADSITSSMLKSEVCVSKSIANNMSGYSFDDKFSYAEDDYQNCLNEYVKTAPSFTQTGRSPLNSAIKHCSAQFGNFVDCGKIALNNTDAGLKQTLKAHNDKVIEWVNKSEGYNCSIQDQEKAVGFCKDWTSEGFKLKTEIAGKVELKADFIALVSGFRENWENHVIDNLDVVKLERQIRLLSFVDQMYSLLRTNKNYEAVATQTKIILDSVLVVEGYERNSPLNIEYMNTESYSTNIQNVDEFYGLVARQAEEIMNTVETNAGVVDKAFGMFKDPMLLYGQYENKVDKENFKLDFFVQRKVHDLAIPAMMTGVAVKIAAGSLSNVTVNTKKKKALLWLAQKGEWLMATPIITLVPVLMVAFVAINIVFAIVLSMLILIVKLFLLYRSNTKFEGVLYEILNVLLKAFVEVISFIFALVFTHILMAIVFASFGYIEVLNGDKVFNSINDILLFTTMTILTVIMSTVLLISLTISIKNNLLRKFAINNVAQNDLINVDEGIQKSKNFGQRAKSALKGI
ncbi:hypothetical protein MA785_000832 [Vibrio parahaemolyticus]|nr:hypothetical protein [Vibrio parahaemolyticus]EJR2787941.1 hypothetical protein [Vibrio parahaemolyticus]